MNTLPYSYNKDIRFNESIKLLGIEKVGESDDIPLFMQRDKQGERYGMWFSAGQRLCTARHVAIPRHSHYITENKEADLACTETFPIPSANFVYAAISRFLENESVYLFTSDKFGNALKIYGTIRKTWNASISSEFEPHNIDDLKYIISGCSGSPVIVEGKGCIGLLTRFRLIEIDPESESPALYCSALVNRATKVAFKECGIQVTEL